MVSTIVKPTEEVAPSQPPPLMQKAPPGKTRVLILGGGFGGLTTALELERRLRDEDGVEIVLVDRNPYHLFTPMLFQIASGEVEPGHIAFPLRWLARRRRIHFYQGEIHKIDLVNRAVTLDGTEVYYDYLVLALGSTTNFFGVRNAKEFTFPLKTLKDAISIKYRILDSFRQAELEPDEVRRRFLLSFAIVGGGANGVEIAASLRQLLYSVLPREYPRIYPGEISLTLCDAGKALLFGMDKTLGAIALKKFQQVGLKVSLETRAVACSEEGIYNAQGIILPAHTIIWASGIQTNPLLDPLPIIKFKDGRARVRATLRLPLWRQVYAVGDNALFMDWQSGQPLPAKAAVAVQQGRAAAINIVRALKHQGQIPFRYHYEGDLVALGRNAALARLWGTCFDGLPAWLVWRVVHLWKLPGMRNQMSVALDWFWDALFRTASATRLE